MNLTRDRWSSGSEWCVWNGSRIVAVGLGKAEALSSSAHQGFAIAVAYHSEGVGLRRAKAAAERWMEVAQAEALSKEPGIKFDDVQLRSEDPRGWTFMARCPDWQARGMVPGALRCLVDRLDSHVWGEAELNRFWHLQGREPLESDLLRAVRHGDLVELRSALAGGADVDELFDGMFPLGLATRRRSAELVRELLLAGANPDLRGEKGRTPLHIAARWDAPPFEVVRSLVESGADRNALDDDGRSAASIAAERNEPELEALLALG